MSCCENTVESTQSNAAKEPLNNAMKECDSGQRPGLSSEEQQRIKALERDVPAPRQGNEILRMASAFFAKIDIPKRRMISNTRVWPPSPDSNKTPCCLRVIQRIPLGVAAARARGYAPSHRRTLSRR